MVWGALGKLEELCSAFKATIVDVAGECLGTHHQANNKFASQGALDIIEQSPRSRLKGRAVLFRELRQ